MSELITCWKIGKKVLTTTKCNDFDNAPCGEVNCYWKTDTARRYFLMGASEVFNDKVVPIIEKQEKKRTVDKGFF